MKNSQICPKCQGQDIMRIPRNSDSYGRNFVSTGFISAVPVIRYICGHCGYTEEWIDTPADLKKLREQYYEEENGA